MDGFDKIVYHREDRDACLAPYQYADPAQIRPYWFIARHYVLAGNTFTTQGSGGFTGHQDLITAGTVVIPNRIARDLPSCSGPACHWGCDAPADTHTSLIVRDDVILRTRGTISLHQRLRDEVPDDPRSARRKRHFVEVLYAGVGAATLTASFSTL